MKHLFMTAVAALAVATGSTFAATAAKHVGKHFVVLWDQNSNFGGSVNSQFYESAMADYNDLAADDFVVPAGQRWLIGEIDVTGAYVSGSGPASSELVVFWHDRNGAPRKVAGRNHSYAFRFLSCADNAGSFHCVLPIGKHNKPVVALRAGTWWVSVIANCDSQTCGQWNWTDNTTVSGFQANWHNPQGAWNIRACYSWHVLNTCFGGSPADLAFKLIGLSRPAG